jgi:hypothetical protein
MALNAERPAVGSGEPVLDPATPFGARRRMTQIPHSTDQPLAHALQDSRERLQQLQQERRRLQRERWADEARWARSALARLTALAQRGERRRRPSEATEINRIEKATGKSVTGVTVAPDGSRTYTVGNADSDTDDVGRELAAFEARHDQT